MNGMADNRILYVNLEPCKNVCSIYSIALEVCRQLDVDIAKVRSKSRKAHLVEARHEIAMRATVQRYTREEIAAFLHRDQSSITYLINNYTPPY